METKLKHPVFYKHIRQLLLMVIAFFCVGGIRVFANDILVSNVRLTRPAEGSTIVHFNLSWKNSFRVDDNWDAAWVFVKYRKQDGSGWKHAFLSNEGHTMPSGAQCDVGLLSTLDEYDAVKNPVLGTFIYRTSGGGDFNLRNVQLKWNYVDNELVDIKVFAIEMVYIPKGEFLLGSGGTEVGSFTNGSWVSGNSIPFKVVNELKKPVAQKLDSLWGTAGSGTGPGSIQDPSSPNKIIPCAFPKGYSSFYCMKYEVTEGQYIDFLSTLTGSELDEYLGIGDFNQSRNSISRAKIDEDSLRGFDKYLPYCGLHWGNFYAFLNWSGLRPMTEFEYEKICRGTLPAVPNEYAWGSTFILQSMGIDKPFTDAETSYNNGNCRYNSGSPSLVYPSNMVGPLRVGASANSATNRVSSGASYYGVQDMSGNGNEWAISAATGRKFKGDHGKGKVAEDKSLSWPTKAKPDGAGTRGGSFETVDEHILRTSDRTYANGASPYEFSRSGRGVRSAEPGYIIPEIKDTVLIICCDAEAVYEPLDERDGRVPNGTTYTWSIPQLPTCITGAISGKKDTKFKSGALQNSCDSIVKVIYHVIPDITDCEGDTFTVTVNVNPKPVINPFTATICSGGSVAITPVNITDGRVPKGTLYFWSEPIAPGITGFTNGSRVASFTSGNLINNTNSPIDVTYTVTPDFNKCNGTPFTVKITVNPLGQVDLPANQTVCKGNLTTISFSTSNTGGTTTYNWTNNTPSIGLSANGTVNTTTFTAINSGTAPVTATITVTPTFTNGGISCVGLPQSFTITVNPLGQVEQPASQTVCNGNATTLIGFWTSNTGGITTYNWTNNTPSIGLAASGTGFVPSFTAVNESTLPVTATITVTPVYKNNGVGCTGPSKTFTITVNPTGQVNQPSNKTVCAGSSVSAIYFSTSNTVGASTYTWTNDNTSIGLSGSGTGNTSLFTAINSSSLPVTATITVTPIFSNGGVSCPGPSKIFTITVNPKPVMNNANAKTICSGDGVSLSLTSAVASSYSWIATDNLNVTGESITAQSGTIINDALVNTSSTVQTVTYTVIPTSTTGSCVGEAQTVTITVNPKPVMSNANAKTICSGDGVSLSLASAVASSYSWIATDNLNVTGESTTAKSGTTITDALVNTSSTVQTVTYTVTPTSTTGSCVGTVQIVTVTVNPKPTISAMTATVCSGTLFSVTPANTTNGIVPSGTTYSWSAPSGSGFTGGTADSGASSISGTLTNSGNTVATATYTVTPTSGSCSGSPFSLTVTVNPKPTISAMTATVCSGTLFSVTPANTTNGIVPSGTTYSWSAPSGSGFTGGTADSGASSISGTLANSGNTVATATYTVTPTSGSCTGNTFNVTITVDPVSVGGTISGGTTNICINSSTGTMTLTGYTGTIVKWQKRAPATSQWIDINYTGASYSEIPSSAGIWSYRVEVKSGTCSAANSLPRTISVKATSVGGTASSSHSICMNSSPSDISLSGYVGAIQWQVSTDNSNFTDISEATAPTLTSAQMGPLTADRWYRAVVTSGVCSSAISNVVKVTVLQAFSAGAITGPASNQCYNYNPTALTAHPIGGTGSYTYQWQSSPNGTSWSDISGATLITYDPPALTTTTHYRVLVDPTDSPDCAGPTASTTLVFPIFNLNTGEIESTGETICIGDTPSEIGSIVDASEGYTILYSWRTDGDSYQNEVHAAMRPTYRPLGGIAGTTIYRRYVNDFGCSTPAVRSAGEWTLTILPAVSYGTVTVADQTICSDAIPNSMSVTGAANSGSFTYQWYYQEGIVACPTGTLTAGWTSLGTDNGANTTTYTPVAALTASRTYAVLVTPTGTPTCGTATWASGCRKVIVNPKPTISGVFFVAVGSTTQLTGSIAPHASTPWTSSNLSVATVSTTGLVTGLAKGSSTITYRNNNGCTDAVTVVVGDPTFKWFTNTTDFTNVANSITDGLTNTKNLLGWPGVGYNITFAGNQLPANINADNHIDIKMPVGAVEYCMRMNYEADGTLKAGIDATNMWYLPAIEELKLIYVKFGCENSLYRTENYWSSTEFNHVWSWSTNLSFGFTSELNKEGVPQNNENIFVRVRCVRPVSGTISSINCAGATHNGTLMVAQAANGVSSVISYAGGSGGIHYGQTVKSTGVTGLTATLAPGPLASGSGSFIYNITGTPTSSGTALFAINIGGKTCELTRTVACDYPVTEIVEVVSSTGRIWMDRNMGAYRAATSSNDTLAFGYLFQWGRGADDHQCRTSETTTTLATSNTPGVNFIITQTDDWRTTHDNALWQGVGGTNNPCPTGYRLPTYQELDAERATWLTQNADGAIKSDLKWPNAGWRWDANGVVYPEAHYWSSSLVNNYPLGLTFNSDSIDIYQYGRASAMSVRCIKGELAGTISSINCDGTTHTGGLMAGLNVADAIPAGGVTSVISYTGGNGGAHSGQTVSSTGAVTGLTATLAPGTFANGNGTLTYTITGTPSASGTATFFIDIGGNTCTLRRTVIAEDPAKPWFTNTDTFTNVANSDSDGLANTTALISRAYPSITFANNQLPASINAYPGIVNEEGAVEYCMRMNYDAAGNLKTDITPSNMWYLPAKDQLSTMYANRVTQGPFAPLSTGFAPYWSSTEKLGYRSWYTDMSNGNTNYGPNVYKSNANRVRCIKGAPSTGPIASIDCAGATHAGGLMAGLNVADAMPAGGVTSVISYTGGNGGTHNGQTVGSTGAVTGLTATLAPGTFANGNGTLTYTITGTPSASGTATFLIDIGGKTCTLSRTVIPADPPKPWFTNTTTQTNVVDTSNGLANTKALITWAYGINFSIELPLSINGYPGIVNEVGAVEYCMRMNYDAAGNRKAGITPSNMWYLPARDQLLTMYANRATQGPFAPYSNQSSFAPYWSSTEAYSNSSWFTDMSDGTAGINNFKTNAIGVRCVQY